MFTTHRARALIVLLPALAAGCPSNPISMPSSAFPVSRPPEPAKIATGDVLEVKIWQGQTAEALDAKVQDDGSVSLPYVSLQVAGLTPLAARDRIEDALKTYFREPRAEVHLKQAQRPGRVFCFGQVNGPRAYPLQPGMTVMDALGAAGGWTTDALLAESVVIRTRLPSSPIYRVDLYHLFRTGDPRENFILEDGDVVYVPRSRLADFGIAWGRVKAVIDALNTPVQTYLLYSSLSAAGGGGGK